MQAKITAGDTLAFVEHRVTYPAQAGWQLAYILVPRFAGGQRIAFDSTPDADSHRLSVAAAETAEWAPGVYTWVCRATRGGVVNTVAQGQCEVMPDPVNVPPGTDLRSQARRALDDANAALAAWSPTRRRYKVGDREQEFNSAQEILTVITYWQRKVDREEGRPQGGRIYFGAR